jgi:hypothetical protein
MSFLPLSLFTTSQLCSRWNDTDDRLAVEVIKDFIALDPETQPRNVTAWTPVVTDVLRGSIEFEKDQVSPSSTHRVISGVG